jgi:hypothetical protein
MKKSALAEQLRVHFLGLGYSPNEMLDCSDDEIIGAIEDREVTKAVTVGDSAVRVLADGSEIKTVWESSAVEIRTGEEKLERRTLPPKFR